MLDNKGFDNWAGEYDISIDKLSKGYPFEGYYNVLEYVRNLVDISQPTNILDLGIGTGLLSYEIYKNKSQIYGIDFSEKMIIKAKEKMPNGNFYCCNFKFGLPNEVKNIKFDYIISSYALHHINDKEKINLIIDLKKMLKEKGKIIIADIGFQTIEEMNNCKRKYKEYWDDDEFYFIGSKMVEDLCKINLNSNYNQISSCAGVLVIYDD